MLLIKYMIVKIKIVIFRYPTNYMIQAKHSNNAPKQRNG